MLALYLSIRTPGNLSKVKPSDRLIGSSHNLITTGMVRGSQYDNPEILDEVIDCHFEEVTKRQFKDSTKVSWLRISDLKENDSGLGIRRGRLRVDGCAWHYSKDGQTRVTQKRTFIVAKILRIASIIRCPRRSSQSKNK